MAMFLGFLTALLVAGWGLMWYRQGERRHLTVSEMKARLRADPWSGLSPEELKAIMVPPLLTAPGDEAIDWDSSPATAPALAGQAPPAFVVPPAELLPAAVQPERPLPFEGGRLDTAPYPVLRATEKELMGYCARCRAKRFLAAPEPTTTRQGRPAVRGVCMICDSEMLVFTFDN